jgi:hypothetical protein
VDELRPSPQLGLVSDYTTAEGNGGEIGLTNKLMGMSVHTTFTVPNHLVLHGES